MIEESASGDIKSSESQQGTVNTEKLAIGIGEPIKDIYVNRGPLCTISKSDVKGLVSMFNGQSPTVELTC